MKFDIERQLPCATSSGCDETTGDPRCADPAFRALHPEVCGPDEPPSGCSDSAYRATHLEECGDDLRCQDPIFAASNPVLCLNQPTLILKPEYATREVGAGITYRSFLLLGGTEVELTTGVAYGSADPFIASISPAAGHATALAQGITTISATYGNLAAYAQLEVLSDGSCAAQVNSFALTLDNSKSASAPFGGGYSTRLSFAKAMAQDFLTHLNLFKDFGQVARFDVNYEGRQALSNSLSLLQAGVTSIAQGTARTDLAQALLGAQAALAGASSKKIVVLFSDGENDEGADPIPVAQQMREEGIIIFVVGLRARGNAFRLLDRIASGGFFINALPLNVASVAGWLSGLKSYICSGNCQPEGGASIGVGSLNFTNFLQWEVAAGHVDLIGQNPDGPALFDLVPGNGLYVDLCGSIANGDVVDYGTMRTKDLLTWDSGSLYVAMLRLAGNNRILGTSTVQVQAYTDADVLIATQTYVLDAFDGFGDYAFQFTPTSTQGYLVVSQTAGTALSGVMGALWDGVIVAKESDGVAIFTEDFDDDNAQEVLPPCSGEFEGSPRQGYGYGYGYDCYDTGCLSESLPAMTPDPYPLPDLEGGITPPPPPPPPPQSDDVLNIALLQNGTTLKTGAAAAGTGGDFWNSVNYTPEGLAHNVGDDALRWGDGSTSDITYAEALESSALSIFSASQNTGHNDPMMATVAVVINDGRTKEIRLGSLPAGTYDIYVYGHGGLDARTLTVSLDTPLTSHGTKSTANNPLWQGGFVEDVNYVKFSITFQPLEATDISLNFPISTAQYINGIQIVKTA